MGQDRSIRDPKVQPQNLGSPLISLWSALSARRGEPPPHTVVPWLLTCRRGQADLGEAGFPRPMSQTEAHAAL